MKRRKVLVEAGGGGSLTGFTMAEILLSLTIIGVVAAITLPSLTGNINERTWNTQRKALYARFSQAIALMPSLNGYGTLTEGDSSTSAVDTAAETFVTDGLSKVLKINNICDSEHLEDCGVPAKINILNGASVVELTNIKTLSSYNSVFTSSGDYKTLDTKAAAFETTNGEAILVYYNPHCTTYIGSQYQYLQPYMCVNLLYDLNGKKGPNTPGKDIGFITVFNPTDPIAVAPVPLFKNANYDYNSNYSTALASCKKQDIESRLPSANELASLCFNNLLWGIAPGNYWSATKTVRANALDAMRAMSFGSCFLRDESSQGSAGKIRCIKR